MNEEKEAGAAATADRSPNSDKPQTYQERFNAALEGWRKEGCQTVMGSAEGDFTCGKPPHRAKMLKPDESGDVTMSVDCVAGHEDVWQFKIPKAEMEADIKRQADAAAKADADGSKGGARDPMIASVKIMMNLRTQQVEIDPWVPTPGLGIQLAGILMSHFFAQLQASQAAAPAGGLVLPKEKKLLDRNGKPLIN